MTTVTLNAAKVLAIDSRVGSLEPGKDADFVLWSGDPLSQFSRAEQTWVDGRRYFSLEEDAVRRATVATERQKLIQAVLSASGSPQRAATGGRN
jgi:cytosine/adenosine deaminase-related metal-dependent hydrolase